MFTVNSKCDGHTVTEIVREYDKTCSVYVTKHKPRVFNNMNAAESFRVHLERVTGLPYEVNVVQ